MSVKLSDDVKAKSFNKDQTLYIDPAKLLPLKRSVYCGVNIRNVEFVIHFFVSLRFLPGGQSGGGPRGARGAGGRGGRGGGRGRIGLFLYLIIYVQSYPNILCGCYVTQVTVVCLSQVEVVAALAAAAGAEEAAGALVAGVAAALAAGVAEEAADSAEAAAAASEVEVAVASVAAAAAEVSAVADRCILGSHLFKMLRSSHSVSVSRVTYCINMLPQYAIQIQTIP